MRQANFKESDAIELADDDENNIQSTMDSIIKRLDQFETVLQKVANNLKYKMNCKSQSQKRNEIKQSLVETHIIIDEANKTMLKFPLATIADLEQTENPAYDEFIFSYIREQFIECGGNISETIQQIVSNQLLNALTWEEEINNGRIPLQNFSLFTVFLYGSSHL